MDRVKPGLELVPTWDAAPVGGAFALCIIVLAPCPVVVSCKVLSLEYGIIKSISSLKDGPRPNIKGFGLLLLGFLYSFLWRSRHHCNQFHRASCFILRAESAVIAGSSPSAIYGFAALRITVIYSVPLVP